MICLLVITDGRDCVERAVASAREMLVGPITLQVMYDDSGDDNHHAYLTGRFPDFRVVHLSERLGFGGAISAAWAYALTLARTPFIFHLEDDFIIRRPVDLRAMADVLDARPRLVQLALRRQPWNDAERAAGGIVEQHPDDYIEHALDGHAWLEHQRFFTTNPSLYRRSLCARGWPVVDRSEGMFSHRLLADDPATRFGFWGARDSGEWVEHVGHERVGTGY